MASPPEPKDPLVDQVQTRWSATLPPDTAPTLTIQGRRPTPSPEALSRVHPAPRRIAPAADAQETAEGDFSLLRVIGEGGMGVVYSARQTSLNREIAIKMLHTPGVASSEVAAKFLAEAAVTGELEHPNIIPIYDVGRTPEGVLFYAMREISGTSWDKVIHTLPLEENLRILLSVCDAVAFAHSRGVLHRDLKPENVMLGEFGEVYVTDWGLAVSLAADHPQSLAHETGLAGTPAYMAPEMAACEFERFGPPTDVYLLGGILYEIVTGLRPHAGPNVYQCLAAALRNEIQPTEKRGELVEIARRAMATNPEDRYPDVRSFQAAIRAYQTHAESVRLSEGADERLRLWPTVDAAARYREANEIIASYQQALKLWPENTSAARGLRQARLQLVELALEREDLALAVSEMAALEAEVKAHPLPDDDPSLREQLARRVSEAVQDAAFRKKVVRASLVLAGLATAITFAAIGWAYMTTRWERDRAIQAEQAARRALAREAEARARAVEQQREAERQRAEAQRQQQLAEHHRAVAEARQAEVLQTLRKVEQEHYRNVVALAMRRLEEGRADVVRALLWSVSPEWRAWEWGYLLAESMPQLQSLAGHAGAVISAAFSPEGERLVSAGLDKRLVLWKWMTGRADVSLLTGGTVVLAAAIHPSGRLILAVTPEGHLLGLDPEARRQTEDRVLSPWPPAVEGSTFSPNAAWLLLWNREGLLRLWDTREARLVGQLPTGTPEDPCKAAGVDSDGRLTAVATRSRGLEIWDFSRGRRINSFPIHGPGAEVLCVAWSPDGRRLATGSRDGAARVWDVSSGRCVGVLRGHTAAVSAVGFSSDGRLLATGSHDRQVCVWDAISLGAWMTLSAHSNAVLFLSCLPDGRGLVTAAENEGWALWDVETARRKLGGSRVGISMASVAVSPDGTDILAAGRNGCLWWSSRSAEGNAEPRRIPVQSVDVVALDPRGGVALLAGPGHVTVWSLKEEQVLAQSGRPETRAACVAIAPDGRWAALGGPTVTLWKFPHLQEPLDLPWEEGSAPQGLAFSPDSRRLLAWGRTGASVFDVAPPRLVYRLEGTASGVAAAGYTPDGRRIATGERGTIRVWDADVGRELLALPVPGGWVTAVAFSPNGAGLWAGSEDGTVRLWQAFDSEWVEADLPRGAARRLRLWKQRHGLE